MLYKGRAYGNELAATWCGLERVDVGARRTHRRRGGRTLWGFHFSNDISVPIAPQIRQSKKKPRCVGKLVLIIRRMLVYEKLENIFLF